VCNHFDWKKFEMGKGYPFPISNTKEFYRGWIHCIGILHKSLDLTVLRTKPLKNQVILSPENQSEDKRDVKSFCLSSDRCSKDKTIEKPSDFVPRKPI